MKLLELELSDFRSYRRATLQFPEGVTGIVGANGAGKSALLEAVGWALFGNVASRTSKDGVRRRGSDPGDPVRVTLRFQNEGAAYEVTRTLRGRNALQEAAVLRNGQVVVSPGASSASTATEFLARELGLDPRTFYASVVAKQKELAFLTDQTPAERKALVARLLGIDRVEEAIQAAREDKRSLRGELEGLRAAAEDPARVEEARQAAAQALVESRRGHEAATRDSAEAEGTVKRAAWRVEELATTEAHRGALLAERRTLAAQRPRDEAERDGLAQEVAEARSLLPQLEALRKGLEGAAALETERRRLEAVVRRGVRRGDLVSQEQEVTRSRGALAEERAALEAALAARPERLAEREALVSGLRGAREASQAATVRVESALAEVRHLVALAAEKDRHATEVQAMGPGSSCPTCLRPLGEHHGALVASLHREIVASKTRAAEMRKAADAPRAAAAAARAEEERLAARLSEMERLLAALDKDREGLARITVEEGRVARRAADLRREIEALPAAEGAEKELAAAEARLVLAAEERRQSSVLEERLARLPALQVRIDALRERIAEAEARTAALDAALAALPPAERGLAEARAALAALQSKEREARERRATLAERAAALEREVARLDERLSAARARRAEADRMESDFVVMEALAGDRSGGLLLAFKEHLVGRLGPQLAQEAGRLFATLCGGLYDGLEVDGDYNVRVLDRGEAFDVARYSGGEQDLAHLALRLAISEVASARAGVRPGFLVLDEVFGSQDHERRRQILGSLKALTAHFPQVLLVTHVDDVREQADHVIEVLRADGESTARLL